MCNALTENNLLQNTAVLTSNNVFKTMLQKTKLFNRSELQFTRNCIFKFSVLSFLGHYFLQRLWDSFSKKAHHSMFNYLSLHDV